MPAHRKATRPDRSGRLARDLRALVENAGTVSEIAKRVGVGRSTLHAVLAGDRLPDPHLLIRLVQECRGARMSHNTTFYVRLGAETKHWLAALKGARAERETLRPAAPRRPAVTVPRLRAEEALTEAVRAELALVRLNTENWRARWPRGITPGWIERYRTGRSIPSPDAAALLLHLLRRAGGPPPTHDLVALAESARRARATARRRAREGRPVNP